VSEEANLPVRVARDKRKADEWSLVLTAADIEHDIRPVSRNWVIVVGDDDLEGALQALDAYDHEQRQAAIEPPPPVEYGPTQAALWYMAALMLFYAWVEIGADTFSWEDAGRAYARRVVAGEWWRVVTALTLHASVFHVLGNAIVGAVFGGALCRSVGPGTGLWIMVLAGAVGNLTNAYLRAPTHAAVGASTAVFAAFGALAGLQMMRRYRFIPNRRKAWVPLGAALAMLAMLGAGEDTDVWAHLFGLIAGVVAGIATAGWQEHAPAPARERMLVAAGVGVVVLSWVLALV
jgi:membrane associated rhomboid family serine protease